MNSELKKYLPGLGFVWIIVYVFALVTLFNWALTPIKKEKKVLFEKKKKNIRPPLDIFKHVSGGNVEYTGFGKLEGPFPKFRLPKVRWGIGPRSTISFDAVEKKVYVILKISNTIFKEQTVNVLLNGSSIKSILLKRVKMGEFRTISIPTQLKDGTNELVLEYSKWATGDIKDDDEEGRITRKLAIIFLKVKIE